MTIGIPNVTAYGSSYGTYGGVRLKDQTLPSTQTKDLNNADAKDLNEWKPFERTVKDFILARLGAPVVKVELTDFQLETCIDEAITKLEYYAPDWMTQYASFETSANVNVYELPQEIANGLNDVWYKRNFFNLGATPGSLEYDFAIMFFTNTGLFNNYNVSQYLLMQQYLKQISNVLSQGATWQLIGGKHLHIWPVPDSTAGVILEFRALDVDRIHPMYKNWIQRYAMCLAKEILGRIRGKFQTLPGPSGGSRLDGESLLAEAKEEKEKLVEELMESLEQPVLFDIF